ncbi:MAG: hypothetical protein IJX13_06840 [Clostridia bacterium]|nr:hypothetical protein [Clostridia bacterium]
MKKLTLYLLLLSMLLSLVACGGGGGGTETTTDTESESVTTPADPEPNPFSNGTEIESIVAVNNEGTKQKITSQTTLEELGEMFPDWSTEVYYYWTYYERVVVAFSDEEGGAVLLDLTNAKLYHYPNREAPTTEELLQLESSMLLVDVVNLLRRLPDRLGGSGMITATYNSCEDTYLRAIFSNDKDRGDAIWYPEVYYINRYHEEPLLPESQVTASAVTAGMKREALIALLPDEQRIDWGEYLLFRDKDGQSVIVTLDESDMVSEVSVYAPPAEHPTSEQVVDFRGKGKTLHDYVEAFGLPYYVISRGETLYIMTTDGGAFIGSATNGQHHKIY